MRNLTQSNYLYVVSHLRNRQDGSPPDLIVDAAPVGNWTRYMNHCCEPNNNIEAKRVALLCGGKWVMVVAFFPKRDIEIGEELTFPYNKKGKLFFHPCLCTTCEKAAQRKGADRPQKRQRRTADSSSSGEE